MPSLTPTPRTTVRRLPDRGSYDRALIDSVLDEALVCHVGFSAEGQPYVLPMNFARMGDAIYFHGSVASRLLCALQRGTPVCATVTLLDGLVLARSAFHHSMNYRSAVVMGAARRVEDEEEREHALHLIVDHVVPGRSATLRAASRKELAATSVLAVSLGEASVKVRTGPPGDEPEDLDLPVWAGVVPMTMSFGEPQPDPALRPGITPPGHIRARVESGGADRMA